MATREQAWDEARRLVLQDGASYAEAAKATGLPLSTLQKRAGQEDWQSQREAGMSYTAQIRAMKALLLKRANEALERAEDASQLVFAWRQAEAAYPEHRYVAPKEDPKVRLQVAIEVLEDIVAFFDEHDRNVLARLNPFVAQIAKRLEARYGSAR